jgi:hypothetical protein
LIGESNLQQLLDEFQGIAKAPTTTVLPPAPCDLWKRLRPVVANLLPVLDGLGTIFPKLKLAADTLRGLESLLDALCPLGAAAVAQDDRLAAKLAAALTPGGSQLVAAEAPCAAWRRLKPVLDEVIQVLSALAGEFPAAIQIADVLHSLEKLVDALCGMTPAPTGAVLLAADNQIQVYEDDPFLTAIGSDEPAPAAPIIVGYQETACSLQFAIGDMSRPPLGLYSPDTGNFRYWNAASALTRGVDFWCPLLPIGTVWSENANPLPVTLDKGVDFNAFYARQAGLNFFHGFVTNASPTVTVFSGGSPHVLCHELGHAVLDAFKPELFNALSGEIGAFHESFGDMSSVLSALQLPSYRQEVLSRTSGILGVNSRLSQLARQLGWAIRMQFGPDAVDADSLRNACNQFLYIDPASLPSGGPASNLSSEVHSFSRVFTGAFLDILAGMYKTALGGGLGSDAALLGVTKDLGSILVAGIRLATAGPGFFSQVAAGMIQADNSLNGGKYRDSLGSSFVRRGILDVSSLGSMVNNLRVSGAKLFGVTSAAGDAVQFLGDDAGYSKATNCPELPLLPITSSTGLTLHVHAAMQPNRFGVAPAAAFWGASRPSSPERVATEYLEDLIQNGHLSYDRIPEKAKDALPLAMFAAAAPESRKTHYIIEDEGKLVVKRHHFDCACARRRAYLSNYCRARQAR